MSEWAVVGVIVVLVGLVASIATPIVKMTSAVTKLIEIVNSLDGKLKELTERNTRSHERIFNKLDDHDETLADHETRLTVLEHAPTKD